MLNGQLLQAGRDSGLDHLHRAQEQAVARGAAPGGENGQALAGVRPVHADLDVVSPRRRARQHQQPIIVRDDLAGLPGSGDLLVPARLGIALPPN